MVLPLIIAAAFTTGGLLMFQGIQFVIHHRGSPAAKLAIKMYSDCNSYKTYTTSLIGFMYVECLSNLEPLMEQLVYSGEVDLDKCELDKNEIVAYRRVWVWWTPRHVILTSRDLVHELKTRKVQALNTKARKSEKVTAITRSTSLRENEERDKPITGQQELNDEHEQSPLTDEELLYPIQYISNVSREASSVNTGVVKRSVIAQYTEDTAELNKRHSTKIY